MKNDEETIEVELDRESIVVLALEAHKKNITLNDFIIEVLKKEVKKFEDKKWGT